MKQSEWNEGLNNLDSDIIENYVAQKEAYIKKIKKPTMWTRYISVAATFCLVFGVLAVSLILNRSDDEPITIPETEAPSETVGGVVTEVTSEDVSESKETTAEEISETDEASESNVSTNVEETSQVGEETTVTPETENNEPYEIKVDDYTLIKNENGCYLKFDDISKYQNNSSNGSMVAGEITFDSIKEFKDRVTKGLLEDWEKQFVASFSNNGVDIQTCDFNNLYEPLFPQGSDIVGVGWKITSYYFMINNDNEYFGFINVLSYEEYEKQYTRDFENALNGDQITIESVEIVDKKEITYYKTPLASLKREAYTLQKGNITVLVDKRFSLTDLSISQSSSIPYRITLYCSDGDRYYTVTLYSLQEDPTDEWLLEFGLKPYIENDHEVM